MKCLSNAFESGEKSVKNWIKKHHADFSAKEIAAGLDAGNPTAASFLKFQAFTTAAVQDQRIRTRLQAAIAGNIKRGEGPKAFADVVDAEFDKAGLTRLKSYQIENIYVTNTSLAYGSGQMSKMLEVSGDFPYWKYSATMDSHTRPDHAALHGKIFRTGDFTFYPPIGFRCRCTSIPLTARQAAQYLKSAMPDEAEKQAIHASPSSREFVGNKQQKYLEWVAQQYEAADAETRKLTDDAFDRMKAEIRATQPVEKPKKATVESVSKPDDQTGIPAEFRADGEYLKGSGIRFKKEFFDLIDKENPIRLEIEKGDRGSYYAPGGHVVCIASAQRIAASKWFKESIIYHEFGHAIDHQRGLSKVVAVKSAKALAEKDWYAFREPGKTVMREMPKIEYIDRRLFDLKRKIKSMDSDMFTRRGITKDDVLEQILSTRDTIKALNPRYGEGHKDSYYRQPGNRQTEFIAHAFENAFAGNAVFKKYLPELYEEMIRFIQALE